MKLYYELNFNVASVFAEVSPFDMSSNYVQINEHIQRPKFFFLCLNFIYFFLCICYLLSYLPLSSAIVFIQSLPALVSSPPRFICLGSLPSLPPIYIASFHLFIFCLPLFPIFSHPLCSLSLGSWMGVGFLSFPLPPFTYYYIAYLLSYCLFFASFYILFLPTHHILLSLVYGLCFSFAFLYLFLYIFAFLYTSRLPSTHTLSSPGFGQERGVPATSTSR